MVDDPKLKYSTISLLVSQAPFQPKEAPIIKEPQYRFRACIDDISISNYRTISLRSAESIVTVKVSSPISMRVVLSPSSFIPIGIINEFKFNVRLMNI